MSPLKLSLALASLSLGTSAFAGNGSGINGPDLSGTAIPAQADRTITTDQLDAITAQCNLDFVNLNWTQLYGVPAADETVTVLATSTAPASQASVRVQYRSSANGAAITRIALGQDPWSTAGARSGYVAMTLQTAADGSNTLTMTVEDTLTPNPDGQEPWMSDATGIDPSYLGKHFVKLESAATDAFPHFTYDKAATNLVYDDFGRLTGSQMSAKSVVLVPGNDSLTLNNPKTGIHSKVTLDMRSYRDCLQSGFLRAGTK